MKHLSEVVSDSHFLINYQIIGQAKDGRLYNFSMAHSRSRVSPFLSIIQRTDPKISPYHSVHLKMGELFSKVITIPPSYAFMVLHEGNRSNRMYKGDTYIDGEVSGAHFIEQSIEPEPEPESNLKSVKSSSYHLRSDWRSRINA
jgi:hypothetical protein